MDIDDLFSQPVAASARAGGKFKPKSKPHPKKEAAVSTASAFPNDIKEKSVFAPSSSSSLPVHNSEVVENGSLRPKVHDRSKSHECEMDSRSGEELPTPSALNADTEDVHSSIETMEVHACIDEDSGKGAGDGEETPARPDDSRFQDLAENDVDTHTLNGRLQTEFQEAGTSFNTETLNIVSDGTTAYEQHTGKFKPKSMLKNNVQTGEEQGSVDGGSLFAPADDIVDYSSMNTNTSNIDAIFLGDDVHAEDVPEMHGEPNLPQRSEIEKGEASTVLEPEEPAECPSTYTTVNEDIGYRYTVEGDSQKESFQGKSKKDVPQKEKPVRKRKKTKEESDQSNKKPRKKFSHSTRRKRGSLDKELLETPEEEIRFLPIKDMLRLTDYKEWLENKEAKASEMPPTKESTESTSHNYDSQNEEETVASESIDNQENIRVQSASFLLNYHSYMQKESKSRWSKQDTELFYEGIRQFGSDLSMIQQLFPDKSRHQIKLKFKFEDRRQTLKLDEALSNRVKNHYYFENVIKKLQEAAAQAAHEADEEEPGDMSGANAETADFPNNEEVKRFEPAETAGAEGEESDGAEAVDYDLQYDGSDAEADDLRSTYKSEF